MTKQEALTTLNIGYFIFIIGLFFGFTFGKNIKTNTEINPFMYGYIFWSTYWGYKIISPLFDNFFYQSPVRIEAKNTSDYFSKVLNFKYTYGLTKILLGLFVGALGGAVFKQIQLSKSAYL